jgi:CheY-like chemotaxis protein
MKVLVADDGASLRSITSLALEPALKYKGHQLLLAGSGPAAKRMFEPVDPPHLAIVDWSLADPSALDFCRHVRATPLPYRPHLIVIANPHDDKAAVNALEAGADDCVRNPFVPAELLARLEAGARIVAHQLQLRAQVQERDAWISQHAPLPLNRTAEVPGGSPASAAASALPTPGAPTPAPSTFGTPSVQEVLEAICPLAEMDQILERTLADMGLGEAALVTDAASTEAFRPEIGIVHFMILPEKSTWLDLLLETDRRSARALYALFAGGGDNVPDSDLVDVMGETLNMIQGLLKATFKSKGVELLVPLVPQSIPPDQVPARSVANAIHSRHLFRLEGIELRFTLFAYVSPIQQKLLRDLAVANVLAEPLRPPGNPELVLINKGTLLNKRVLKKVSSVAEFAPRRLTHPVFEPSPLTALLPTE